MGSATLLVVDDHQDFLTSVVTLLEHELPEVDVATETDPRRALRILETRHVDAIMADYRMPGMNGLDFLLQAAKIAPEARRVLVTAYHDLDVAIRAINEASISYYIRKPSGVEEIIRVARAAVEASEEPDDGRLEGT